ncbi:MAG TPA: DUF262 domain-containing protein [Acidobacteriaceae bacterium]|jgi:hypothetical protein|nr:DUF262 domain-containing protein [Acidobacteriaceae bacterium]
MVEQGVIEEPDSNKGISESEIEEWFESEEESADTTTSDGDTVPQASASQLRIIRSSMDLTLHSLRRSMRESSYINMHPGYQRRHRWDSKKRSRLIESLLLNIPIPPIFLFESDLNRYEVMDGSQRLEAITGYLDNGYKLSGLEFLTEIKGYSFDELTPTIQRSLLRRTINAIVLLAETTSPKELGIDVRMVIFNRLNTGGVKLNPQELRNALYPSEFNRMLVRVSEWDVFRDTWGIPKYTAEESEAVPKNVQSNALYKTMADCELVLRFFAIKETVIDGRQGSLRRIMDDTMSSHQTDPKEAVDELEQGYRGALKSLFDLFDGQPFVLPQTMRPSRPAYDALMVASTQLRHPPTPTRKAKIQSNFAAAASDPEKYEILVGRGNTVDAIKARVNLAMTILTE